jgi:hypothetical protein
MTESNEALVKIAASIDKALALISKRELVSSSEMQDILLDIRVLTIVVSAPVNLDVLV